MKSGNFDLQIYTILTDYMNEAASKCSDLIKNFFSLVYPGTCCTCGTVLVSDELHLCSICLAGLPATGFQHYYDNQLTAIFWGRVALETGTSLYYYQKGGLVQTLIHQIKYRGNKSLGFFLGRLLGIGLLASPYYSGLDYIVPVPLHPDRERARGFNQSDVIASGVADVLSVPNLRDMLVRGQMTASQTKKARFSRWENVSDVFETPNPSVLYHKNILLVDDVVTTGSTLEACAQKLVAISGVRVWIATLAITV